MSRHTSGDEERAYTVGEGHVAHGDAGENITRLSDEQLVLLVARRHPNALGVLYDRHARYVMGMAMAVLHDESVAEEVVQDVFLKLWRQPESYDAGRGRLAVWILSVARNRAIDVLRSRHPGVVLSDQVMGNGYMIQPSAQDGDPDETVSLADQRSCIRVAIQDLPAAQCRVVELAYFAGMTHTEIAAHLRQPLECV